MKLWKQFWICLSLSTISLVLQSIPAVAQTGSATAKTAAAETRDGQHDFDFLAGTWKFHLKRRLNPLTGSNTWVEFDGVDVDRKIWDGKANLDELELDGPAGHLEGLTLRLYNPQSHQWMLYWANGKAGVIGGPPNVGEFKNGHGEFYCQDTFHGRMIFIRYVWSDITANSAHFEQSFSDDGGKTWEVNWITDQTRVSDQPEETLLKSSKAEPNSAAADEHDGQHDFDPLIGSWRYHLKRLDYRTHSKDWENLEGTGTCYRVWNGRANLDTIEVDGPSGHIEGLTLRLYNPQSHEWRLYWANSKVGVLDPPQVGEFKAGHGDFYTQDTINGRTVFIRYDWSRLDTNSPHFEQAFSDDGGRTWAVNWITDQTRVNDETDKGH